MANKTFSIIFDGIRISVFNVIKTMGHDDSIPFNANFEIVTADINSAGAVMLKTLASGNVWNDGWGGECQISCTDRNMYNEMNRINEHMKGKYSFVWKGYKLNVTLYSILEDLSLMLLSNPQFAGRGINMQQYIQIQEND